MKLGTKKTLNTLIEYLEVFHIHIGWVIRAINVRKTSDNKWGIIISLLHSIIESCDSIKILLDAVTNSTKELLPKSRDITIISRSILETALNIVFILAKGEDASEKARRHYLQKTYRNLNFEFQALDQAFKIKLNCDIELDDNEELKQSIEEFTSNNKKPKTQWTEESSLKKIQVIHSKYGKRVSLGIQIPYEFIYSNASEYVHGTFFSAMLNAKLADFQKPPSSPEEIVEHQRCLIVTTITMLLLVLDSLTRAISIELPHDGMNKIFEDVIDSYFNEEWMQKFKSERGL